MRVFLILSAFAWLAWYFISRIGKAVKVKGNASKDDPLEMVKDPVCGKFIARDYAVIRSLGSETKYYCSDDCALRDT